MGYFSSARVQIFSGARQGTLSKWTNDGSVLSVKEGASRTSRRVFSEYEAYVALFMQAQLDSGIVPCRENAVRLVSAERAECAAAFGDGAWHVAPLDDDFFPEAISAIKSSSMVFFNTRRAVCDANKRVLPTNRT